MHRNTFIFVIFLAIFAALVAGVNIGKRLQPTPPMTLPLSPTPSEAMLSTLTYTSRCGFSIQYPALFALQENSSGSAILRQEGSNESVVMACQKNIPRPPIPASFIESRPLFYQENTATVAAKLYHDKSAEDGTPIDALIFTHPKTGLDIFIAGYGTQFNDVVSTLLLLSN